jgi:hypothetical protein
MQWLQEHECELIHRLKIQRTLAELFDVDHVQELGIQGCLHSPATRKDVTPLIRKPGGLMEQSNASLQRGDQG